MPKKGSKKTVCSKCRRSFFSTDGETICPLCKKIEELEKSKPQGAPRKEKKKQDQKPKSNQYKRPRRKKSKRTCLRCDREFMSDGIYNRICPTCRESNANIALPGQESIADLVFENEQELNIPSRKS